MSQTLKHKPWLNDPRAAFFEFPAINSKDRDIPYKAPYNEAQ